MQENSPKTTSSSRRSQTSSDNRGSRSSASNPSTSRRRRDMVQNTAPTNQQQSIVKSGPTRGSNTLPDCEPPTLLFQELSIGASRPRQPKRHLYQKRQESTTKTQSSTTPGSRTASLPDRLHDVHLQERLEEEGLADIAEDDERATAQRRVASAGTSHASTTSPPAASTSKCTPGKASSRPLPEVQEDVNDELSCTPVSDTNSLRFILAQELRALQDGTRSPKLNWPQSRPPSRSSTSSPESVIFENKAAEVIEPGSFLAPKTRAVYPEGQGLPLGLEDYDAGSESSSANPTLDSTQAAKPPPLLPHVYRFGMDLPAQVHAFGGSSEYPIAAPRPMHWISPPRPIPALHGPSSIPYARCPSGAEGEIYDGTLRARDLVWPAYQERVQANECALHPDYVAVTEHHGEERQESQPDVVVLVDADLTRASYQTGKRKDRLSRPLMDATNPQQPPRTPSLHSPRLGHPLWRAPSFRSQGTRSPCPPYHAREPSPLPNPEVTPHATRPTLHIETTTPTTSLYHYQRNAQADATARRGQTHRNPSPTKDNRLPLLRQTLIDQEKERLQLEEQELQRRLEEEYRRLACKEPERPWDGVETQARDGGDFNHHARTPSSKLNDAGSWVYNGWSYLPVTPAAQVFPGSQTAIYNTYGYFVAGHKPVAPPGHLPYSTNPPVAQLPGADQHLNHPTTPGGGDAMYSIPHPDWTYHTAYYPAQGYVGAYNGAYRQPSYYVPETREPRGFPSTPERTPSSVLTSELSSDSQSLSPESSAPPSLTRQRSYPARLSVSGQPFTANDHRSDRTLVGQEPRRARTACSSPDKSVQAARSDRTLRAAVLQPITARLSSITSGTQRSSTAAPLTQRPSPKLRRQTYAETLGKGLPSRSHFEGLPTPPGSGGSETATRYQEKHGVSLSGLPALEPNALNLAWGEPLLEHLPGSWGTSDDGRSRQSQASQSSPKSSSRQNNHHRKKWRNNKKRNNSVPVGAPSM